MADVNVRNLYDGVASALKARAKASGISLEEEIRRTLAGSSARTICTGRDARG